MSLSLSQAYAQTFPGKPTWTVQSIPDLTGKVTIVTGGNVGVGKETIKALLIKNAKVYLAARSQERAQAAIADLENETGRRAIWLQLDLSDMASVCNSAQTFLSLEPELHILFNNAGVMNPPVEQITKDGFDLQFGTNVVGHYLFTKLLTPALRAAAQKWGQARVVHTSSSAAYFGAIDFDTFTDGPKRKKLGTQSLYTQSKLGNILVAREFAKRYAAEGILHASVNPGNLKTDLQRHANCVQSMLIKPLLYPAPYGALTQLFVGTMDLKTNGIESGKFYVPWAKEGPIPKGALDDSVAAKLWTWLEDVTKEFTVTETR